MTSHLRTKLTKVCSIGTPHFFTPPKHKHVQITATKSDLPLKLHERVLLLCRHLRWFEVEKSQKSRRTHVTPASWCDSHRAHVYNCVSQSTMDSFIGLVWWQSSTWHSRHSPVRDFANPRVQRKGVSPGDKTFSCCNRSRLVVLESEVCMHT